MDYTNLQAFLAPVDKKLISDGASFNDLQLGALINIYVDDFPDLDNVSLVILGIGEQRGSHDAAVFSTAPDVIRTQFYQLFHWHTEISIADIGNIKRGATMQDSYAALKTITSELLKNGKTVIILGGSHDLTYAQYQAYAMCKKVIEATVVDALIDLQEDTTVKSSGFLMDMFTVKPNFLKHYNHIGFQSYFVQPKLLETLDKLRFDCYRSGFVQENLEDMEPVLRHSDLLSIDISAIRHSDAPANMLSPNGFFGHEMCSLTRYAGMSNCISSIGIYGYQPEEDSHSLTARQIAQMIWYFIEGRFMQNKEAPLTEREAFLEFHVRFTDVETLFLKSKRTGRWWMQMPDQQFVPCTYKDYLAASSNEMPERWLRVQERF
jgi:arginase family enzyme